MGILGTGRGITASRSAYGPRARYNHRMPPLLQLLSSLLPRRRQCRCPHCGGALPEPEPAPSGLPAARVGDPVIVRGGDTDPAVTGRSATVERVEGAFVWVEGRRYNTRDGRCLDNPGGFDADPFWVEAD